jgi:hypothetical protein
MSCVVEGLKATHDFISTLPFVPSDCSSEANFLFRVPIRKHSLSLPQIRSVNLLQMHLRYSPHFTNASSSAILHLAEEIPLCFGKPKFQI